MIRDEQGNLVWVERLWDALPHWLRRRVGFLFPTHVVVLDWLDRTELEPASDSPDSWLCLGVDMARERERFEAWRATREREDFEAWRTSWAEQCAMDVHADLDLPPAVVVEYDARPLTQVGRMREANLHEVKTGHRAAVAPPYSCLDCPWPFTGNHALYVQPSARKSDVGSRTTAPLVRDPLLDQ